MKDGDGGPSFPFPPGPQPTTDFSRVFPFLPTCVSKQSLSSESSPGHSHVLDFFFFPAFFTSPNIF